MFLLYEKWKGWGHTVVKVNDDDDDELELGMK